MDQVFIYPNWHVAVVHYPLGLLAAGLIIEVFSVFWRHSTVRQAGRWMMLIGAMASVPAVTLGLYAFRDVMAPGPIDDEATWHQAVKGSDWTTTQWEHVESHLWFEAGGSALAVLAVVVWLACSDLGRRRFYAPGLILLLIAMGLMSAGAWYAGEGVYRHRVAVQPATTEKAEAAPPSLEPAPATGTAEAASPSAPAADPVAVDAESEPDHHEAGPAGVERYIAPMELHLLLAGMTVAVALGAIGLTLRRWAVIHSMSIVAAVSAARMAEVPDYRLRPESAGRPVPEPRPTIPALPSIYPARVWLWALLLGLGTAAAGAWLTGDWQLTSVTHALRQGFSLTRAGRLPVHAVAGAVLLLLLFLGAVFTRVAPRHRVFTLLIVLVLVIAVAAQMWLGILLLFDSDQGPLTGFNAA